MPTSSQKAYVIVVYLMQRFLAELGKIYQQDYLSEARDLRSQQMSSQGIDEFHRQGSLQ